MIRRMSCKRILAGAALLGTLAASLPAKASRRDFPFTYDWKQPSKGEKEIELKSRYRGSDNTFEQQIEFEYGITDRFMLAPYLVFERGPGEGLRYTEFKLESRYQLGKYQTGKILPGLYLEGVKPRRGAAEIEGKLILSRYGKKGDNLSFNYIVERELESGAELEHEYSFGYVRPFGKGKRDVRGGFEWIHNLSSDRINAGPVIGFAPSEKTWITTGYAFPLSRRDGNRGEFRLIAEYEWF